MELEQAAGGAKPVNPSQGAIEAVARQFGIELRPGTRYTIDLNDPIKAYAETYSETEVDLYNRAFNSPVRLAATLVHEQVHQTDYATGRAVFGEFRVNNAGYATELRGLEAEYRFLMALKGGS